MPHNPLADEVWRAMATLVIDNRDSWKRAVVEQTGLFDDRSPPAVPIVHHEGGHRAPDLVGQRII